MERSDDDHSSAMARRWRWVLVVGLLAYNLVLFGMGALAAGVGGGLSDWGKGAGGLDGWADLAMTIFSLIVGLGAGITTFRERGSIPVASAVFVTGLLVGSGYLVGGHLVDPCDRGWWDFASNVGDTRLCSPRGDIAVRFHLVLHAIVGVLSAGAAALMYRRTSLIGWWPPAAHSDSRTALDVDGAS